MATVLVVDDRSINREFLAALLGYAGHRVTEAADGHEALQRIADERPELIVTDLMMPGMDGSELARRVRADPAIAAIPIIFYTATYRFHEARDLARECNVELVLPKPSEPHVILEAVGRFLGPVDAVPAVEPRANGGAPAQLVALQRRLHEALGVAEAGNASRRAAPLEAVHSLSLKLAAVLELGLTMSSERDATRLVDMFCRAAREIIGTQHAGFVEFATSGQATWQAAGRRTVAGGEGRFDPGRAPLAGVLAGTDPIVVAVPGEDPATVGFPPDHPPFATALFAPMRSPSGRRGFIYFLDKVRGRFNDEDTQLAATLAVLVAQAVGNLALFADLERHSHALESEIADHRRTTVALRESDERFRQMAENINEVFFLSDADDLRVLYINPAYEWIWGRPRDALYANGLSWLDAVHPEDRQRVASDLASPPHAGENEYRIVRPDGAVRWIRVRTFPIRDASGRVHRVAGLADDATERVLATRRQQESERRFATLLGDVALIAVMLDADGVVTYCNDFLLAATGWSRDEVLGRSWVAQFVAARDRERTQDALADLLAERPGALHFESEIVTRQGSRRLVHWNNTLLRSESGEVVGTASLGEDITVRSQAQSALAASEARYRELFDASPLPMWVYDLDSLRFVAVNQAAVDHYGYTREAFLAMTIEQIRPHAELDALRRNLAAPRTPAEDSGIWKHLTRDGRTICVEIHSHALEFDGRAARLVLAHDVTVRIEQERRIARLSRVRSVIGALHSMMVRCSDQAQFLQEACRVATTEGVFPMAWITARGKDGRFSIVASSGRDGDALSAIEQARAALPVADWPSERAARTGAPVVINDFAREPSLAQVLPRLSALGFRSGVAFPLSVSNDFSAVLTLLAAEPDFFDDQEVALLKWMTSDMCFALEHIRQAERLDFLSLYDPVTALPNARLFQDRLAQFIHLAWQERGSVCVVVFDLEHFTRVNETLGRHVGDELLRAVAHRLHEILVEPYTLGRISGDTFAVASPRGSTAIATTLPKQIFGALAQPLVAGGQPISVAIQAGVAIFPSDGGDEATLFRNAELALKVTRSRGERISYSSAATNAAVTRRLRLEDELRQALQRDEFVLHYQARIALDSGELVGAEALIRWQHPERGLLAPGEFVPLAEETGQIEAIGAWVIEHACAQMAAWSRAGLAAVPVAVNVSPLQVERGDLVDGLQRALGRHGVRPQLLELELTESAVMRDPQVASDTLRAVKKLGVRLALDDFGTGHSSLAQLKRFPFDAVKIDRSFVTEVTSNPDDAAIAAAIIAVARQLRLRVVAEGVETAAQLSYLRSRGCDEIQGFLVGPAVPADEFANLLRQAYRLAVPEKRPEEERTLLIVDDEAGVRNALQRTLRRDGYRILLAASGREALERLAEHQVQVIISDQRMPEMSGTQFLERVQQLHPDTLRIILSGYTDLDVVTDAVNRGAVFRFLTKPWDDHQLREQVRDAFRRHDDHRRARREDRP